MLKAENAAHILLCLVYLEMVQKSTSVPIYAAQHKNLHILCWIWIDQFSSNKV